MELYAEDLEALLKLVNGVNAATKESGIYIDTGEGLDLFIDGEAVAQLYNTDNGTYAVKMKP